MSEDVFTPLKEKGITAIQLKEAVYEVLMAIDPTERLSYLLTVNDVTERLCLHPDTVRRYCREGKIRAFRLGTKWRIRPMDYVDFIEKKRTTADERIMRVVRERQEAGEGEVRRKEYG